MAGADVLLVMGGAANITWTSGESIFHPVATTTFKAITHTTVAHREGLFRTAGTLGHLYVRVTANTNTSSVSYRVFKNGVDVSFSVTILAAVTGTFENNSIIQFVSVAVNDRLGYRTAGAGGGSVDISIVSTVFTGTSATMMEWATTDDTGDTGTILSTTFFPIANLLSEASGTDAGVSTLIRRAGTWQGLTTLIVSNTRTATTTIRTRINAANGTGVLSIPSTSTGVFTDTVNTDAVAAGDLLNYSTTVGGTGTIRAAHINSGYESVTPGWSLPRNGLGSMNALDLRHAPLGGEGSFELPDPEAFALMTTRVEMIATSIWANVTANSINLTASTFSLRRNAVDTGLSISIPASTTGTFENTGSEAFLNVELISYTALAGGATGTLTISRAALTASGVQNATATPATILTTVSITNPEVSPTVAPATILTTVTIPDPSIITGTSTTVVPATILLTTTIFEPSLTDLIDGSPSLVLAALESAQLTSDGASWWIISDYP